MVFFKIDSRTDSLTSKGNYLNIRNLIEMIKHMIMDDAIFWDIAPCIPHAIRHFGETDYLYFPGYSA
jgi:hypothetical protein